MKENTSQVSTAAHRIFVIASLLFASGAVLAIPRAQASTIVDQVDIIDGQVDVDESGSITYRDDSMDVLLFFNNVAPIRVDIIDGLVDVTEGGVVSGSDDLTNVDLNHVVGLTPTRNQVDIIDGFVDVNEGGTINTTDDLTDVKLVKLVGSVVDQVDIIDAEVDVNEDGIAGGPFDEATDVLLAHKNGALIRVDVIDGRVDVSELGFINEWAVLYAADLNQLVSNIPSSNEVDISTVFLGTSGGWVDVNQLWGADTDDDAANVKLVKLVGSVFEEVDIINGQVDVTDNGSIDSNDDLDDLLLLFDEAAPIRVDIIDGRVDVTENGSVTTADDLPNTELTYYAAPFLKAWPGVDIINGEIDVDEDGSITSADDLPSAYVLIP